ncbi:MAG: PDZ domain-containing protein [Acidobacteriota bacterium]
MKPTSLLPCVALSVLILSAAPAATPDTDETLLLRFPDIHGDAVAFVYAGDIWVASAEGGTARRLTSHPGQEVFPKFSPDGNWIAFSGEYGGNRQVFIIPVTGGTPRQLTFYNDVGPMPPRGGFDNRILGWTPDGANVLFRANRLPWGVRMGRPYLVPVDGGLETPLAIPEGGGGDLSPDGFRMAYTPIDREFRTWKRYRGGRAQDVWIYDLTDNTAERITTDPATDNQPVWIGDTIYFTSDRTADRKLNLWAYDTPSRQMRQVTKHEEFDVLWPSGDGERVVYQNGGALWIFDPSRGKSSRLAIHVAGDLPGTLPRVVNVKDRIESGDLSPSGKRALYAARGDLFTVPAEHGEIRNLTRSSGVREISPVWSPDGTRIAYLSDRSGEYEIYTRDARGAGEETRVTTDGDIWCFPLVWSPDSKKLAFADKKQRLRFVDIDSNKVVDVDHGRYDDITTYIWSPDSAWLVYTRTGANQFSVIRAYELSTGESVALTDELTSNRSPAFDPEGRYLYFVSNRDFNLTFSGWEFNYLYTSPARVYVATLNDDIPMPFAPRSDEEETDTGDTRDGSASGETEKNEPGTRKRPAGGVRHAAADTESENDAGKGAPGDTPSDADRKPVRIQAEGFANRVSALPGVAPGNYFGLTGTKTGVLYATRGNGAPSVKQFDMEKREEKTVLDHVGNYVVSHDGKKLLYRSGESYGIVDARPGQKNSAGRLGLDHLEMRIDPRAEWEQMFTDGWRLLRDWFYDPDLHGVNWERVRKRYGRLVPYVAHRADLDFLLGEVGGELNASHIYIQTGDQPQVPRRDGGLLGAELTADAASGRYRITHIFPGENWHPAFRSPLTEPGVHVSEGDFLLAIDGQQVTTGDNPYRFLVNTADRLVTLTVNDHPALDGARQETVRPVKRETNLRYLDWVLERRRRVEEASNGRIGYIHMPNTAQQGNRELFKYFYPQANKEALILDVRYNGGGFIPDRMIELLDRPVLNYWARRGLEPGPTPAFAHTGPKVCLINGYSSSGGDAFPYYFRKRGLGPLIGTRTWGGLIGLSGNPALVDGGSVLVSEFRFMSTDGEWAVENEGVSPDIEVIDAPDLVAAGRDPSLEQAIDVLMKELAGHPPRKVTWPKKWKDPAR